MIGFFSVHTHSRKSKDDALSGVTDLVTRSTELGYPALGLTDHGTMGGTAELYTACRKAGIKPLPGLELYLTPDHGMGLRTNMHLTVVSYTAKGYLNLVGLNNLAQRKFAYKPRLDFADLAGLAEDGLLSGLAVATGCRSGPVVKALIDRGPEAAMQIANALAGWFPRVYVELMDHHFKAEGSWDSEICEQLLEVASETGLPYIVTTDAHYAHEHERAAHDALKTLVVHQGIEVDDRKFNGEGYWLRSEAEILDQFGAVGKQACINLAELAEMSSVTIPELDTFTLKIPDVTFTGRQQDVLATRACELLEGFLADKSKAKQKVYNERLLAELDVIELSGFAGYLLLVIAITDYCAEQGIWFYTRGSATGSLLLLLFGVTQEDPVEHEIRFDRFLSADRDSPPDVDLDIEHTRRDEVVAHFGLRYPVLQVGTTMTYGIKSESEEEGAPAGGSLAVKYYAVQNKLNTGVNRWQDIPDDDQLMLRDLAERNLVSGRGAHPGGYVLAADEQAVAFMPLEWIASSKTMVTALDKGEVEKMGLPKIDLLGSRVLTALHICCDLIVAGDGREYYRTINMRDKATFSRLAKGNTVGLFQFGGWTNRKVCEDMGPTKVSDLTAIQALARPAPMASGFTKAYMDRRADKEAVPEMHEDIAAETKDTYGLAIYQEQLVGVLRRLGLDSIRLTRLLKAVKASGKAHAIEAAKVMAAELDSLKELGRNRGWSERDVDWLSGCLNDYGAGYCVTGDTVLWRSSGGRFSRQTMTIKELHDVWHGPSTSARKKYRGASRGLTILARDCQDGRVRPDRVVDVIHQGVRQVFTVRLESGHQITATANHKHATEQGWLRVDQLQVGDLVAVMGEPEPYHRQRRTGQPRGAHNGIKALREQVRARQTCQHCALVPGKEIAHLDQDESNNTAENLAWLCCSCHRIHDHAGGSLKPRHSRGRPVLYSPIVAIEDAGEQEVYDVSMAGDDHSWVANGIITSNSFGKAHAAQYGCTGYRCGFLAEHEPLAYWTGMLIAYTGVKDAKTKEEIEPRYKAQARRDGVHVWGAHVNSSGPIYTPDPEAFAIREGLLSVPQVGKAAAAELCAKAPYVSLVDLAQRVTTKVTCTEPLLYGTPAEECGGHITALFKAGALAGIEPGEPLRRAKGRIRRCQECKVTFPTPLEYEDHAEAAHPAAEAG